MKKLIVLLFFVVAFFIWDFHRFLYSTLALETNLLVVQKGSGFNDFKANLISKNDALFATIYYPLYIKYSGVDLKLGAHLINPGTNFIDAVTLLNTNPQDIKVRLPEGGRMEQFVDIINGAGL